MPELLQGFDTATQITALADWLGRRQVQPPQRIWISTDSEHAASLYSCGFWLGAFHQSASGSAHCP